MLGGNAQVGGVTTYSFPHMNKQHSSLSAIYLGKKLQKVFDWARIKQIAILSRLFPKKLDSKKEIKGSTVESNAKSSIQQPIETIYLPDCSGLTLQEFGNLLENIDLSDCQASSCQKNEKQDSEIDEYSSFPALTVNTEVPSEPQEIETPQTICDEAIEITSPILNTPISETTLNSSFDHEINPLKIQDETTGKKPIAEQDSALETLKFTPIELKRVSLGSLRRFSYDMFDNVSEASSTLVARRLTKMRSFEKNVQNMNSITNALDAIDAAMLHEDGDVNIIFNGNYKALKVLGIIPENEIVEPKVKSNKSVSFCAVNQEQKKPAGGKKSKRIQKSIVKRNYLGLISKKQILCGFFKKRESGLFTKKSSVYYIVLTRTELHKFRSNYDNEIALETFHMNRETKFRTMQIDDEATLEIWSDKQPELNHWVLEFENIGEMLVWIRAIKDVISGKKIQM